MNGNRAQRRLAARQKAPPHAVRVLHALIDTWLEDSDLGRSIVASGVSIEEARQAILWLQQEGLASIEVTDGDPLQITIAIDPGSLNDTPTGARTSAAGPDL